MAITTVCIDANVIVALADAHDKWHSRIVEQCRQHQGRLNFHDALMALACQELDISGIVSFDGDFDQVAWLRRISEANQVQGLITS